MEVNTEKIKNSIDIIINSGIKYEFRTTVYPKYIDVENVERIAKYLKIAGSKSYVLQNYYSLDNKIKPYSEDKIKQMQEICSNYLQTSVRGII